MKEATTSGLSTVSRRKAAGDVNNEESTAGVATRADARSRNGRVTRRFSTPAGHRWATYSGRKRPSGTARTPSFEHPSRFELLSDASAARRLLETSTAPNGAEVIRLIRVELHVSGELAGRQTGSTVGRLSPPSSGRRPRSVADREQHARHCHAFTGCSTLPRRPTVDRGSLSV
jgi:hypothetical protein